MFKISNLHPPSTPNPFSVMGFQDGMAINQKRDQRADELICAKVKPHFSCVLYAPRRNNSHRSVRTLIPNHSAHGLHDVACTRYANVTSPSYTHGFYLNCVKYDNVNQAGD